MKLKSQNLLEFILIVAIIAVLGAAFVMRFNFQALKNYIFDRPADPTNKSKIKIEAMTP